MLDTIVTVVKPTKFGISTIKKAPDGLSFCFGVSFYVSLAGSFTLHGIMPEVVSTGSEAGTTLGEVGVEVEVEVEVTIMTPHRRTTTPARLHTTRPILMQAKKDGDLVSGLEFLAVPLQDIWQEIRGTRIKQGIQTILAIKVTTVVVFLIAIMEKEALHGEAEGERDHLRLRRLLLFLRLGMKAPDLGRQVEDSR